MVFKIVINIIVDGTFIGILSVTAYESRNRIHLNLQLGVRFPSCAKGYPVNELWLVTLVMNFEKVRWLS